jgi:hypothetical protein
MIYQQVIQQAALNNITISQPNPQSHKSSSKARPCPTTCESEDFECPNPPITQRHSAWLCDFCLNTGTGRRFPTCHDSRCLDPSVSFNPETQRWYYPIHRRLRCRGAIKNPQNCSDLVQCLRDSVNDQRPRNGMVYCREHLSKAQELMGRCVQSPPPHRSIAFFRAEDANVNGVVEPCVIPEREKEGLWARPVDLDAVIKKTECVVYFDLSTRQIKCCGLHICSACLVMMHELSGQVLCPECRRIL